MDKLNIVILSGGSGNDKLIRGIKSLYRESDVTVIVNAYDAGKSTGICRKVTNTLGVSDIRKNHSRLYETMTTNPDKRLLEFYNSRYDFTDGNEVSEITELLDMWDLSKFSEFVVRFFENDTARNYKYTDFNVSNIVYSQMYKELGYEKTNNIFCTLLGLPDFVILNSFDNVELIAETKSGNYIYEEGDIVEYKNPNDIITDVDYELPGTFDVGDTSLNPVAIDKVLNADLIIISTGTFWSSIYPTLHYCDFYEYINKSKAKKIWAMNNTEDKDAYGVTSNMFISFVSKLGLKLSDFTILENLDAVDSMKMKNKKYNIAYYPMGNTNGKHDATKYARAIFKIYYGLSDSNNYSKYLFDFDDTIWSRNKDDLKYSIENIELLNKLGNRAIIISGNSYKSISSKLASVYGTSLSGFNIDIWADANSILYRSGKRVDTIDSLLIKESSKKLVKYLKDNYGLETQLNDRDKVSCLKIKPLEPLTRKVLTNYLNDYVFNKLNISDCKAVPTGYSTIDILNVENSKDKVYNYLHLEDMTTLYVGDEVDNGNDKDISEVCDKTIHVSGVEETNIVLKLLLGE